MKTEDEEIDVFNFVIWKLIESYNQKSILPTLLRKATNAPMYGMYLSEKSSTRSTDVGKITSNLNAVWSTLWVKTVKITLYGTKIFS